jgi:hypothetical protein
MNARSMFSLASEWHVAATPDAVFALLENPRAWPTWWRYVHSVESLAGERDFRFVWNTRLPYRLCMDIHTMIEERPWLMVGAASGDVRGIGRWELDAIPLGTRVRYFWQVSLDNSWMQILAPLLAPVFTWNHHAVMRAGAEGMARTLNAQLFDYWRHDER